MQARSLISIFLIFLRCHLGDSVTCYACYDDCTNMTTKVCPADSSCIVYESWADGRLQFRQKDCVKTSDCVTSLSGNSQLKYCCNQDLCNKAIPRDAPPAGGDGGAGGAGGAGGTGNNQPGGDITPPTSPIRCQKCSFLCLDKSEPVCNPQEVCVIKTTKVAGVTSRIRGCSNTTVCNKETSENFMGSKMSFMNKCCNTDMCNAEVRDDSAVPMAVPALVAFATLVAMWFSKLP